MITVLHLSFEKFQAGVLLNGFTLDQKDYFEAAQVRTDYIGEAYGATQHGREDWTKNERVVAAANAPYHRSSMVGDILVRDDMMYMVMGAGYKSVHWGNVITPYKDSGELLPEGVLYPPEKENNL